MQLLASPDRTLRYEHWATPFRLFFTAAGASACIFVALWYLALAGHLQVPSELGAMGWHAHEMIFGYLGAVLIGFLLTAAASWTGRPTVGMRGTAALLLLWCVARVVHWGYDDVGGAAWLEFALFAFSALAIAIPIVAARRWKNAAFVVLLLAMAAGDVLVHLAASERIAPHWGHRGLWLAIDSVAATILIFAGRILPLFTKNALGLATVRGKGWLDYAGLAALAALMAAHVAGGSTRLEALAFAAAGALTVARLVGWGMSQTRKAPLLWVLHLGWLLVGVGMLLVAAALYWPLAFSLTSAHHLLFVGGYGVLTIGMMARVALGHTGREKVASRTATLAFVLVLLATAARVGAGLLQPANYVQAVLVAALAWGLGFAGFLWAYLPVLLAPRADGKPG